MSSPIDRRDKRDPTALGEALDLAKAARSSNPNLPLSDIYDDAWRDLMRVPDYDGSNDITTVTQAGAKH